MLKRVGVFCGSRAGNRAAYAEAARHLGRLLAGRGLGLVYGGGNVGLMGILADAALEAGGAVYGAIPQALLEKELAHRGLTELRVVATMHERKAVMADWADGFIALPGGYGTADELFEILTWAQLGIHRKPVGLLNTDGFFNPLLDWLGRAVRDELLKPKHQQLLLEAADPGRLLDLLQDYQPPEVSPKWAGPAER